jgi:hypothetical protein
MNPALDYRRRQRTGDRTDPAEREHPADERRRRAEVLCANDQREVDPCPDEVRDRDEQDAHAQKRLAPQPHDALLDFREEAGRSRLALFLESRADEQQRDERNGVGDRIEHEWQ